MPFPSGSDDSMNSPVVLVVDDCINDAELTIHALKTCRAHPRVTWLSSADETLRYMIRSHGYPGREPDGLHLVLLAVELPGIDSISVLQRLKRDPFTVSTPIAMLSSCADAVMIRKCYQLGANSYIIKPISAAAYFQKIAAVAQYWLELNSCAIEPATSIQPFSVRHASVLPQEVSAYQSPEEAHGLATLATPAT